MNHEKRTRCTAKRITNLADLASCEVEFRNGYMVVKPRDDGVWEEAFKTRREVLAFLRGIVRGKQTNQRTEQEVGHGSS